MTDLREFLESCENGLTAHFLDAYYANAISLFGLVSMGPVTNLPDGEPICTATLTDEGHRYLKALRGWPEAAQVLGGISIHHPHLVPEKYQARLVSVTGNVPADPVEQLDPTARPIEEVLQELAATVPEEEWANLPTDLSERHDGEKEQPTDAEEH